MNVTIRAATKQDYPTIVSIAQSATTDYVQSIQDLESADKLRAPNTIAKKLVAITPDLQIVGVGTYAQSSPKDEPQRYNLWLFVPPSLQGKGIGKRLYDHMMAELVPRQPRCLETGVRTDLPRAVRFLEDRGFVEVMSECETHLDLATFAPEKFQADIQRMAQQGITLKTLAELASDPQRDAKLYDLHFRRQEEGMETGDLPPFAEWQARFWRIPRLLLDGFCVAMVGEQYIGQSNALASGIPTEIEYGYTGVLPAYRNQGIARAMKVYVLRWAKEQGYTLVRSFSDHRNEPMLRVNLHLGAVIQPPVLWMNKIL